MNIKMRTEIEQLENTIERLEREVNDLTLDLSDCMQRERRHVR